MMASAQVNDPRGSARWEQASPPAGPGHDPGLSRPFLPDLNLPFAIRLPLMIGLAILVCSIGTTRLAILVMQREADRGVERLAQIYVDSLSGRALPLVRTGDHAGLAAALEQGMGLRRGVDDLAIVVADAAGRPIAQAGTPDGPPPLAAGETAPGWFRRPEGGMGWIQEHLPAPDGGVGAIIAAQIAFPEEAARRRNVGLVLVVVDAALAVLAALLAVALARRMMRPFLTVTAALRRAGTGHFEVLSDRPLDREAAGLAEAFNMMVRQLSERERMANRLAEGERAAVLGRLAASIAHEVRNPLAGMLTALDTIRRFGCDPATRERALDLVERGLRQIEAVVRTTLATHRPEGEARPLSGDDLQDLQLLVAPEARRGGVRLGWRIDLTRPFAADGQRLRQLLLNLLLNAVAATPPGRSVALAVSVDGDDLLAQVEDEAGGMPPGAAQQLEGTSGEDPPEGLGLEIAAQLAATLGARIDIHPLPTGTRVSLRVPPRQEDRA